MRNKYSNFAFGVYRSVSVLFILILASMQCKICNRFFTILSCPRWPIDLKLLQVCQFMYNGGLHAVLTPPATSLLAKTNSVMFLPKRSKYQVTYVLVFQDLIFLLCFQGSLRGQVKALGGDVKRSHSDSR